MTVDYLNGGERPLAAQMNALFTEFDRRLALLLSDRTFLLLPPDRRDAITPLLGQCFYFLSATAPNFRSYGWPSWDGSAYDWSAISYPRDKRHALAELIIENPDVDVVIPDGWDYYDTFRIHNLGRASATVTLDSSTTIEVPAWSCRTARRTSGGGWLTGLKYFNQYGAGDPRCWYYNQAPGFANNVVNPTILLDWVVAFEGRQWESYVPNIAVASLATKAPADNSHAGRFQGARWQADPTNHLPTMTHLDTVFGELDDGTAAEDVLRHRGIIRVLDHLGDLVGDYGYSGVAHIGDLTAYGITPTRKPNGDLLLSGSNRQLLAESSNLMGYRNKAFGPYEPNLFAGSTTLTLTGGLPLTVDMRFTRQENPHALGPVDGFPGMYDDGSGSATAEAAHNLYSVFINVGQGRSSQLSTARANGQTVGELKELDWLWSEAGSPYPAHPGQDTTYGTHENRQWLRTPLGNVLATELSIPQQYYAPGTWLPWQRPFPGRRVGRYFPLVTTTDAGVRVKCFVGMIDGAWPEADTGDGAIWLSPLRNRIYGYKAGRSAPFVEKDSLKDYRLLPVETNDLVKTAIAQRMASGGTGFGWWNAPDFYDWYATFGTYPEAGAILPAGVSQDDVVVVGPLLHDHYNLLAWRVNSLSVYDPLDLQDIAWPCWSGPDLDEASFAPRPADAGPPGATLAWWRLLPNTFPETPKKHFFGWTRNTADAALIDAIGSDLGGLVTQTAMDIPHWRQLFDQYIWSYVADITWTAAIETRGFGSYRTNYTGRFDQLVLERCSLDKWMNEWNVDGNPKSGLPHRDHRWIDADQAAALAAAAGLAFRHVHFGTLWKWRDDDHAPNVTTLQRARYSDAHITAYNNYLTYYGLDPLPANYQDSPGVPLVQTNWSDDANTYADETPNTHFSGLCLLGGDIISALDGDMIVKQMPWAYPTPAMLFNPFSPTHLQVLTWNALGQVYWTNPYNSTYGPISATDPDLLATSLINYGGAWVGKTGSLGIAIPDAPLTSVVKLTAPLDPPDAYRIAHDTQNFTVLAWGLTPETLRRGLPAGVNGEVQMNAGLEMKFEGAFSEEQFGALYQVFCQGERFQNGDGNDE